ncbi:MAG: AraC family transcriptional regulator ligand-binding domain-containing protein [Deltaproteobacteria bacterium]|nr:AraC family transcriptional regulator ligand-binding domain-containing protein [Deltaproteobacteria bacterium]
MLSPTQLTTREDAVSGALARGLLSMADAARAPHAVKAPLEDALADAPHGAPIPADAEWSFWEAAAREPLLRDLAVIGPGGVEEGTFGELELALRSAPDVRSALSTLADASDVLHGVPIFHLVPREDGSAAFVYESAHTRKRDAGNLAAEVALATVVEAMRRVAGDRHVSPVSAWLMGRPMARLSSLSRSLSCPVETGAVMDRLELERSVLDHPLPDADKRIHELARRVISLERRERCRSHPSIALRRALVEAVLRGEPTLEGLADAMSMRPRALRGRLAAEELGLRELVDDARRRAAEHLLLSGSSPTDVHAKLGYSDLPSFRRACRRWWGMGPRARRALLHATPRALA